jgi:hypothetical protein
LAGSSGSTASAAWLSGTDVDSFSSAMALLPNLPAGRVVAPAGEAARAGEEGGGVG